MHKVVAISLLVLVATIGLSAYAYAVILPGMSTTSASGVSGPGAGTMNFYLADAPPNNATLKYLLVNVTSITLKYSSNLTESTTTMTSSSTTSSSSTASTGSTTTSSSSTTTSSTMSTESNFVPRFVFNVSASAGTNVNLTKLQGPGILLGSSSQVPAGNVTGIIFNITGAEAIWTNGNHTQLKVVADGKLMINVQFTVQSNGTTNLTVDLSPGDIHVSPGQASVLRPVVLVNAVSSGPDGTQTTETTETPTDTSSTS